MWLFLRFLIVLGVIMVTLYVSLSLFMRERRRILLKDRWKEEGRHGRRADYVREGMREYDASYTRKLQHLVVVAPPAIVIFIIYVINFQ